MKDNDRNASNLKKLQKTFIEGTLESKLPEVFSSFIKPGGTLSESESLNVYTKGYTVRLCESLGDTYEAIWRVLGDELFFAECGKYINLHPSRNYNLNDYGKDFSTYLAHSEYSKDFPFLSELAKFEWRFKKLFNRKQHQTKTLENLSEDQLMNISFEFGEASEFFGTTYSIYKIWSLKNCSEDNALSPDEWEKPERLFLYKLKNDIHIKNMTPFSWALLKKLYKGMRMMSALEETLEECDLEDEGEIQHLFSFISSSGIVTSYHL